MAYGVAWDEAAPIGATTPAADIDVELQNLKISLRERLDNLVGSGNWANDAVDPKVIQTQYFAARSVVTQVLTVADQKIANLSTSATSGDFTNDGDDITITNAGTYAFVGTFNVGTLSTQPVVVIQLQLTGTGSVVFNQAVWAPKAVGGDETPITLQGIVNADAGDALSVIAKNNNAATTSASVNSSYFTLIRLN